MKTEKITLYRNLREGYQQLLRAEAELLLPEEYETIAKFYRKLSDACLNWATDVMGEELKQSFSGLESVKEKSRFRMRKYSFRMRVPWESTTHAAVVCESVLEGEAERGYHRTAHLWNLSEQTALPHSQILQLFRRELAKADISFSPEGIYPENGKIVIFSNATAEHPFLEQKVRVDENAGNSAETDKKN